MMIDYIKVKCYTQNPYIKHSRLSCATCPFRKRNPIGHKDSLIATFAVNCNLHITDGFHSQKLFDGARPAGQGGKIMQIDLRNTKCPDTKTFVKIDCCRGCQYYWRVFPFPAQFTVHCSHPAFDNKRQTASHEQRTTSDESRTLYPGALTLSKI